MIFKTNNTFVENSVRLHDRIDARPSEKTGLNRFCLHRNRFSEHHDRRRNVEAVDDELVVDAFANPVRQSRRPVAHVQAGLGHRLQGRQVDREGHAGVDPGRELEIGGLRNGPLGQVGAERADLLHGRGPW